jgi:hypothetical protein
VNQIVDFENGIFSAQASDRKAGSLTASGATGGPQNLSTATPGVLAFAIAPYTSWQDLTAAGKASVFRGQQIFNTRPFTVAAVSGFNDAFGNPPSPGVGGPVPANCGTCHNAQGSGADIIPAAQRGIGIGGDSPNLGGPVPSPDLPIFKLTCPVGSTAYNGTVIGSSVVITTNDPGAALITGKCADIGKFTGPPLRGLAARAPYFSDGSASNLTEVVNFYKKRFSFTPALSDTDVQDLANFLGTL